MIWVQTDENQVGFYLLKFLIIISTKGILLNIYYEISLNQLGRNIALNLEFKYENNSIDFKVAD